MKTDIRDSFHSESLTPLIPTLGCFQSPGDAKLRNLRIPLWKGLLNLGVPLESQTTNPNHQLTISWFSQCCWTWTLIDRSCSSHRSLWQKKNMLLSKWSRFDKHKKACSAEWSLWQMNTPHRGSIFEDVCFFWHLSLFDTVVQRFALNWTKWWFVYQLTFGQWKSTAFNDMAWKHCCLM